MSVTYSIDHVSAITESVLVEVADKANFSLVRPVNDPKTGENQSIYTIASGDVLHPATAVYRSALNVQNAKTRRISAMLNTWARKVDTLDSNDKLSAISGGIILNVPQDIQVELADLDQFVGNIFSLMYPSVTSGVRSTATLAKLLFGITQL